MLTGSLHRWCSAPASPTAPPAPRLCLHRPPLSGVAYLRASRPQVQQKAAARQPVVAAQKAAVDDGPVASATLRFKPGSAHKLRRVLDQIRGCSYEEALMILEYLPYRAVEYILPTLLSAAANAKENLKMSKLNLYISECYADQGPALKRFTNGYKGRAYKILKPVSHLTIRVKERSNARKSTPTA